MANQPTESPEAMAELLPCPFCGARADLTQACEQIDEYADIETNPEMRTIWTIECSERCQIYQSEQQVAIAAWNQRDAAALQAERERALEEAAVKCETLGFPVPIDELIGMTKKEMSILACNECAKAIRALAQKGGG